MERVEGLGEARRAEVERTLADYLRDEGFEPNEARLEAHDFLRNAASRIGSGIEALTRWWWVRLLQGVLAIAVGAMFFARPQAALEALLLTLGAWAIVDGIFWLVAAVAQRSGYLALGGAAGLGLGYLVLTRPLGAAIVFYSLAAIWIMARGITEISFGASLRTRTGATAAIVALGILTFLFGLGMLISPLFGGFALAYALGSYAAAYGVFLVVISLLVRSKRTEIEERFTHFGQAQPLPT